MEASKTHPGRDDRLAAIKKGWDKASAQMKATVVVSIPGQQDVDKPVSFRIDLSSLIL
jgi:hypothetical protein